MGSSEGGGQPTIRSHLESLLSLQVRSSLFELAKKTKFHLCRHVLVTIILLVIINLLVIFIPSMKDIFGVVGTVLRSFYTSRGSLWLALSDDKALNNCSLRFQALHLLIC